MKKIKDFFVLIVLVLFIGVMLGSCDITTKKNTSTVPTDEQTNTVEPSATVQPTTTQPNVHPEINLENVSYQGLIYNVVKGEAIVIGYEGTPESVNIPAYITLVDYDNVKINVTCIGKDAFKECTSVTTMIISEGILSIGEDAFYGCENLIDISIPNSIKSIGYLGEICNEGLKFNTYDKCAYIGNDTNPYLILLGILLSQEETTTLKINSNTKIIDCYAFGHSDIKSIKIPSSVTSIGDAAFACCSNLANVTFEEGSKLTSIGDCAFEECSSLTSIEIPNGVTSIGGCAFEKCSNLTSIEIPNSVTSIGSGSFYRCSSLTSIAIPKTVTWIGSHAFEECYKLTSIIIPLGLTSIGEDAFFACNSLTTVYYTGISTDWSNINFGLYGNSDLTSAQIYFYSETQPATSGNYWHYDADRVTPLVW